MSFDAGQCRSRRFTKNLRQNVDSDLSRAAPAYEKLLSGIVPVASQARTDFAQFLAVMYARTPTMRRMSAEIHGRGLQIHSFAYASDDEAFERLTR